MPPKKPITIDQRRALRTWVRQQATRPSQKACIEWFGKQYNRRITQSTVSESLSSRFDSIDNNKPTEGSRIRLGQWPDLEAILLQWQERIEAKGGVTSGELLQEKARQIWKQLPQYANQPCPDFSLGWLQRFKKRHHIRARILHGEAASVSDISEEGMRSLRTLAGEYAEENIYNMDETGLYWRMVPSRGLTTSVQAGVKKDKSRITVVLCVNSNGTDRFPVWLIGNAKTPRALRGVSVPTMGGEWRWNRKAWMNTEVMKDWLRAFYAHVGTQREVLLTMDNFSAHISALELVPPPPNIRISWLPPNSTSRFQPLDQGIIQAFKAYYRRQWLSYMLDCFDQEQNPLDYMNLHLAIRWIVRSWNTFVASTTIYNCFRKSTLFATPLTLTTHINPPDIQELYQQVQERVGDVHDFMAISNFLNPIEEATEEETPNLDNDAVLEEILEQHLDAQPGQDEEEDEPQPEMPSYTIQEARQALHVLISFTESREDIQTAFLRDMERLEQQLQGSDRNSRRQITLDSWIT